MSLHYVYVFINIPHLGFDKSVKKTRFWACTCKYMYLYLSLLSLSLSSLFIIHHSSFIIHHSSFIITVHVMYVFMKDERCVQLCVQLCTQVHCILLHAKHKIYIFLRSMSVCLGILVLLFILNVENSPLTLLRGCRSFTKIFLFFVFCFFIFLFHFSLLYVCAEGTRQSFFSGGGNGCGGANSVTSQFKIARLLSSSMIVF